MAVKTINIPIECLVDMLKHLKDEEKDEVFEKVFIESDSEPLTKSEKESIARAEKEFERGETVSWPAGE